MKKFETPEIELIKFAVTDVVTVSGEEEEFPTFENVGLCI